MKVVIPGGTGHCGSVLVPALKAAGHDVVVLSRGGRSEARVVPWDGKTIGAWTREIDGADAVINLAGKSVDCRYSAANLQQMMWSRVDSTRAVGEAIARAARPPRVWLQASTATIYAHRFDAANDEATGVIGGHEPGVPAYWRASIDIAQAWERVLAEAPTPRTRKVAMRSAIVMIPRPGTAFTVLARHARSGFGGAFGDGAQYVSWIHEQDFARSVLWLLAQADFEGAVNVAAPNPLPQRDFTRELRVAYGVPFGLPVPKWALEIGTFLLRSETELVLKSRRVVPARMLAAGFEFDFPAWPEAARDLAARSKRRR